MRKRNPLVIGALILTVSGLLTRFIGFFYRIFLTRVIGAEGMGIYQLIFPVYGIFFSLCCGPIQTAISRYVAAETAKKEKNAGRSFFYAGLLLSLSLSFLCAAFLYRFSDLIAVHMLMEPRAAAALQLISLSIPVNAIHSCIVGYYYGHKKTGVPAFSQLAEQIVRVIAVWLMANVMISQGKTLTVTFAVAGMVLGEVVSALVTVIAAFITFSSGHDTEAKPRLHLGSNMKKILYLAIPLTANRMVLSVLQSAEAIMIPSRLQKFGMANADALSVYGVLTGMALPFILFPSTLTNSISVMLLPDVAQSQSANDGGKISRVTSLTMGYCLYIGILCTGIFVNYGQDMGELIFNNSTAGTYIMTLAWLCPFLYLATTVGSVINGLGKTGITFIQNVIGLSVRLIFVLLLIPKYGIIAYLWGMLVSELVVAFLHIHSLRKRVKLYFSALYQIVRPVLALCAAIWITRTFSGFVPSSIPAYIVLAGSCLLIALIYVAVLFVTRREREPAADR